MDDACCSLAVPGFVALWRGQRPRPADLGADPATVAALERQGPIEIDPDGRLAGIHGLSTRSTAHRIRHAGRDLHTWCAFDAIGIPAALGLDAVATTSCPTCRRRIEVGFAAGVPAADAELRLWLPNLPCDHLIDDLCAHANLYCNLAHLSDGPRPPGEALTVADTAALGRATWHDVAAALAP